MVEIVSPDDETYEKFGFYAAHQVDELLVIDGLRRTVEVFELRGGRYERSSTSTLLGVKNEQLAASITWPSTDPTRR